MKQPLKRSVGLERLFRASIAVVLAALTLGAARVLSVPTAAADTSSLESRAFVQRVQYSPALTCYVTGDLVGDLNPALVRADFCNNDATP